VPGTLTPLIIAMIYSRFAVIQLGARRRYAVPLIFFKAGLLGRFYTDILVTHGWPQILRMIPRSLQPPALRRSTSRGIEVANLPRERVKTFPWLGMKYALQCLRIQNMDARTRMHFDVADDLSRRILECGLGDATHLYCFDTASLGVMRAAAATGMHITMEQTNATRRVWTELLQREREKYPGWEICNPAEIIDDIIQNRYQEAWELADVIVCGSEFVREGIARCGGPVPKCAIVPYGVDFGNNGEGAAWQRPVIEERYARRRAADPLRVLTVGKVGLNKGAPYVLEAAKAFGKRAQFRMVGAVALSKEATRRLRRCVQLVGFVPRVEVSNHYRWADVFLFPSVCEGSAGVVYEALAHGLPVICTPNTGSVVKDGVDGLIVEASSGAAVIAALEKLIADPQLCRTMGQNAFATSDQMDLKHYGERLLRAVGCGAVLR
jgi:glycosyltransferase involved in cell wall biosynthesis